MGGGFARGMNDSLKQNREPLSKERRSFFKKDPKKSKKNKTETDHQLSTEEMEALKSKLRAEAKESRKRDVFVLLITLTVIGIIVTTILFMNDVF